MTRVLPLPAPARMSTGPSVVPTASRCCGLSWERKDKDGNGSGVSLIGFYRNYSATFGLTSFSPESDTSYTLTCQSPTFPLPSPLRRNARNQAPSPVQRLFSLKNQLGIPSFR